MKKIKRICYDCQKELTLAETVAGQTALEIAMRNPNYDDLGDRIRYNVKPEEFIHAHDRELLNMLKSTIGYEPIDGIHICFNCVEKVVRQYEEGRMKYVVVSFYFTDTDYEEYFEVALLTLDPNEDREARVLEYIDDFTHASYIDKVRDIESFYINKDVGDQLIQMAKVEVDCKQSDTQMQTLWNVYKQFRVSEEPNHSWDYDYGQFTPTNVIG